MSDIPFEEVRVFANYGLLGAVCIIQMVVIVYLYRQTVSLQEQLVSAWREIGEIVKSQSATLASWTAANEARTRAIEATARAQELAAAAHSQLALAVAALQSTVQLAFESNRELREDLKLFLRTGGQRL